MTDYISLLASLVGGMAIGDGLVPAPLHEIRTAVVNGVTWTYRTGYLYVDEMYGKASPLYPNTSEGVATIIHEGGGGGNGVVPSKCGVYIGDGTNSAISASISGHISVPTELGGDRVIGISANAFSNCTAMTCVTIPTEVLYIEDSAFTGCSGLTRMAVPFVGTQRGNSGVRDAAFGVIFGERPYDGGTATLQQWTWYTGGTHDTYCIPSCLAELTITDETVLTQNALRSMHLTSVVLPSTLAKIGANAFWDNVYLPDITIPEGVVTIDGSAFRNCTSLTNITIASSVTSIGDNAFNNTHLERIPDMPGVTALSDCIFENCRWMTVADIPQGVTDIGYLAFNRCPLTEIRFSDSVKNIGRQAFVNVPVSRVEIPPNVQRIGDGAFNGCTNLTYVTLSQGLRSIGEAAFANCTALPDIVIPDGVVALGLNDNGDRLIGNVFSSCTSLHCVVLPGSIQRVADGMFRECRRLSNVVLTAGIKDIGTSSFQNCEALEAIDIPEGVTNVADCAFKRCVALRSVRIPVSTENLGEYAFYSCTNLQEVAIGDGVRSIGYCAFGDCVRLFGIAIPASVKTIEIDAFRNCTGLEQVTFSEGLERIEWGAFRGCSNVAEIDLPATLTTVGGAAFWGWTKLHAVTIPTAIKHISGQVFENCTGLRYLTISAGVETIESAAFRNCSGLTRLIVPQSVTNVAANAFAGCSGLYHAWLPEELKGRIDASEVFSDCGEALTIHFYSGDVPPWFSVDENGVLACVELKPGTKAFVIPDDVTSIGDYALAGLSLLESVVIPSGVVNIGNGAFIGCDSITNIVIPGSVESVGNFAFSDCSGLTSVTIPNSVTSIGDWAFSGCSGLTSVTIPASVTSIGDSAFLDCSGLASVIMSGDCPFFYGSTFRGIDSSCVVYLPRGNNTYTVSGGKWQGMTVEYYDRDPVDTLIFTVTFDAQGGSLGTTRPTIVTNGCAVGELPVAVWDGPTFDGWFTAASGGTKVSEETIITTNVTFYAQWTAIVAPSPEPDPGPGPEPDPEPVVTQQVWTVTFDVQGGSLGTTRPTIVTNGCAVGELPVAVWDGHTFDGWFTAADVGSLVSEETIITTNVTFYAHWTAIVAPSPEPDPEPDPEPVVTQQVWTVTFDVQGGLLGAARPTIVTNGCAVGELPVAVWDGHTFDGWFTAASGGTKVSDSTVVTGNVTYYAHWMVNGGDSGGGDTPAPTPTPTNIFTVTFDANGGSLGTANPTMVVTNGVAYGKLPVAERVGYAFDGWANGLAARSTMVTETTIVTNETDHTLYAHWTEIPPPLPPDSGELDVAFAKAQTVDGALYKGDALVGMVQVKVGKISKKGVVKVSATASLLVDGKVKKVTAKAVNVTLDAQKRIPPVKVVFKEPIREMAFEMAADGKFTLKNGSYLMAEAKIGGAMNGGGTFSIEDFNFSVPGILLDELLPDGEPFEVSRGKWKFAKAATVKWAKPKKGAELPEIYDEESGKGLIVDDSKGKTNLSGLKLTYTAKTGQFKGSFKAYALQGNGKKTKLAKYTVNVIGFVVDGVGHGEASCKKPAGGPWAVVVE